MSSFFGHAETAVELGFSTTTKQITTTTKDISTTTNQISTTAKHISTTTKQKQKMFRSFCCGPCFDDADMTFALGLARLRREVDSRPPSRRNYIAPSSRRLCRLVDVAMDDKILANTAMPRTTAPIFLPDAPLLHARQRLHPPPPVRAGGCRHIIPIRQSPPNR